MKNKIFSIISVIFIMIALPCTAFGDELAEKPIIILVDGKEITLDQPPVLIDNYALVPVRAVVDNIGLGAAISTDFTDMESRLVYINIPGYKVTLKIDSTTAIINGKKAVEMDIAPMIINNRTMVPLRFVAENFGTEVEWVPEERIIALYKGRGKPIEIDPALMPVVKIPSTNEGFESYYTPFEYSDFFVSSIRGDYNGDLFSIEGYVDKISEIRASGGIMKAVIVVSGSNSYAMILSNSFSHNQFAIGKYYRFYGAFMSAYADMPSFMLLRAVNSNGAINSMESSGFTVASAFEGDFLESADEIKAFLDKNAQDKSMGRSYFTYEVKKSSTCDFAIVVGFNEGHEMGNALRFGDITDSQRADVEDILKSRMSALAYALTQKCPSLTLEGYYYDRFTGIDENGSRVTYTMRHASWTNNTNVKGIADGPIIWLPSEDMSWNHD